jgi:hypothetical protein
MGRILANLRLRTKFLLSMILVIAGLTWLSLLIVRHSVQDRARQELTTDLYNSLLMLDRLQRERQLAISRKADLLATSAFLSNNDPTSFTDSTDNPLDTSKGDLVALADNLGTISAFRSPHPDFLAQSAETLLASSLRKNRKTDWWLKGGHLYQVILQPIGPVGGLKDSQTGTVVVGQELDESSVRDLGRLLSSQVALRYIVISRARSNSRPISPMDPLSWFFAPTLTPSPSSIDSITCSSELALSPSWLAFSSLSSSLTPSLAPWAL